MSDKLKFSELIRLGSKIMPECRDRFERSNNGVICESCAVTAAWIAKLGTRDAVLFNSKLDPRTYWILEEIANDLGVPAYIVCNASARHANSKLSREQVADWVEQQGY